MSFLLQAAFLLPGVLRIGAMRVPVFGLFAAAGLILALSLSQRTARLAGIDAVKLWDAGMFAVAAAFIASRVLLIAVEFPAFLHYPLLVLSMPSLTYGGMVLTALLVWGWLRWKRLHVLSVLDAWAPCAMALWAILALGHFVEGTDAGMPTRLPWGVVTPGDTVLGKVHPVEIYAMLSAIAMLAILWRMLAHHARSGRVAGIALVAAGLISFALDMFRQPVASQGEAWLDPAQWAALAATLAGGWILATISRIVAAKDTELSAATAKLQPHESTMQELA